MLKVDDLGIKDVVLALNPKMTIRNFKELVLGIVKKPFFLQFNIHNEKCVLDLKNMVEADEENVDQEVVVVKVYTKMDVFTLNINPETAPNKEELPKIIIMENQMSDHLNKILDEMKKIFVEQDPKYENYDIKLDFGSGQYRYESDLVDHTLQDFGITRFSKMKYKLKTVSIRLPDGSIGQISL